MSLVKTLAKVALGVAVAKGVSQLAKSSQRGATQASSGRAQAGTGRDDLFGELSGMVGGGQRPAAGNVSGGAGGGLGGLAGGLGGLLAGMGGAGGGSAGGLGGLLESLAGGGAGGSATGRRTQAPGGLEAMLGAGGIGGLLGALTGGAGGSSAQAGGLGGGLGGLLNAALSGGQMPAEPSRDQELAAALMLKAMIQAVKADGQLDAEEKKKLMAALDEASQDEVAFVNAELAAPLDIGGLVAQVPQGMEAQVYAVSLSAINLDNQAEAQYLDGLAKALGLAPAQVNTIHDQLHAPHLYT